MLSLFLFFEGRPKASRRVSVSGPGRGPQGAGDRRCEFGRRGRQSVSSDLQSVLSVMCFICSVVISRRAAICREEPDGGSLGGEGAGAPTRVCLLRPRGSAAPQPPSSFYATWLFPSDSRLRPPPYPPRVPPRRATRVANAKENGVRWL